MFKFINWSIKTILFLTGLLPLFRCSSGYREKNGKATYNGKEIDDKNFIVLNASFAKDATTAYYKERPFSYADAATFEALDEHYAKDKEKVYYCDQYREGQNYYLTKKQTIVTIQGAMPASFSVMASGYARDNRQAYFRGIPFSVREIKTLTVINELFVTDAVQAYYDLKPVAGSDGKTFKVLNSSYAKDTTHIYFYGYANESVSRPVIIPCDRKSFEILDYPFSKDKSHVFFQNEIIIGMDAGSFTAIQAGYSKDSTSVYLNTKKIVGADPETFIVLEEEGLQTLDYFYCKDKAAVYWKDKKVAGANAAGFKISGLNYGTDGQHVFYKTLLIKVAEAASFKVFEHGFGEADAADANNQYLAGVKVVPQ